LAEIDVNPPIIDQHVVHLLVRLLALIGCLELDECVL